MIKSPLVPHHQIYNTDTTEETEQNVWLTFLKQTAM